MNSDLRMLREFGESRTPPADQPPADLRRRVLTSALSARDRRTRSPRRSVGARLAWRFGAIGATAAAVTAAMLVGQTGHLAGTAPPPAASGASPEAVRILQLAAHQVTAAPAPAARPDQFVFVESVTTMLNIVHFEPAGQDPNAPRLAQGKLQARMARSWRSVDGTRDDVARYLPWRSSSGPIEQPVSPAGCRDGRRVIDPAKPGATEACTPRPAVRADLPTDVDAMVRYLYRPGNDFASAAVEVPADDRAFWRANNLVDASLTVPAVQAALFRAVARIPRVTVARGVVDAAGRRGVAVTLAGAGLQFELIFDATTYRYLGSNVAVVDQAAVFKDFTIRGMKPGDPITQTAILRVAIVDKAGQLP